MLLLTLLHKFIFNWIFTRSTPPAAIPGNRRGNRFPVGRGLKRAESPLELAAIEHERMLKLVQVFKHFSHHGREDAYQPHRRSLVYAVVAGLPSGLLANHLDELPPGERLARRDVPDLAVCPVLSSQGD